MSFFYPLKTVLIALWLYFNYRFSLIEIHFYYVKMDLMMEQRKKNVDSHKIVYASVDNYICSNKHSL